MAVVLGAYWAMFSKLEELFQGQFGALEIDLLGFIQFILESPAGEVAIVGLEVLLNLLAGKTESGIVNPV